MIILRKFDHTTDTGSQDARISGSNGDRGRHNYDDEQNNTPLGTPVDSVDLSSTSEESTSKEGRERATTSTPGQHGFYVSCTRLIRLDRPPEPTHLNRPRAGQPHGTSLPASLNLHRSTPQDYYCRENNSFADCARANNSFSRTLVKDSVSNYTTVTPSKVSRPSAFIDSTHGSRGYGKRRGSCHVEVAQSLMRSNLGNNFYQNV